MEEALARIASAKVLYSMYSVGFGKFLCTVKAASQLHKSHYLAGGFFKCLPF